MKAQVSSFEQPNGLTIARLLFTAATTFMLTVVLMTLSTRSEAAMLALLLIAPTTVLWSKDPSRVRAAMMSLALLYAMVGVALRLAICH